MYEVFHAEKCSNRRINISMFCSILFMGSLVVADITSIKLFQTSIYGFTIMFPVGTLAFAITFLCTDVIIEVQGRSAGVKLVWISVFVRVFILIYFYLSIGSSDGSALGLSVPSFWTAEEQKHYQFIFGGTIPIYFAGFAAVIIAFLNDVYLFSYLRQKHQGKNLYWLRNSLSTMVSQVINSTVFITFAFGNQLSIPQIVQTILGQCVVKIALAWLDTPFAYLMRNYGQGRVHWCSFWKSDFYKG